MEKCDWLNQTVDTLWPYVKVAIARSVKEALTPVLEGIKPKLMMTQLGFSGLDLGTAAPMINGIKTQKHLEEQVVIDIDLLFATQNTDIVFSYGNPGSTVNMNIELSDFLLRGTLRIEMKPLFPRWPTFGSVSVSFTETPTVNFNLKTLYVNWMGLPALSSLFRNAICSAIEGRMVWPNKILVPMVPDLSKVEMESLSANRPLGMLVVKNLQLSGVVPQNPMSRWTGLHSFQVQLNAGKESEATETIHGQSAYDFGDQCYHLMVLDPKTQDLNLSLDYKETLRHFKLIDSKWIHLDHLEPHTDSREIIAFGRDSVGQAEFDLTWYPFSGASQAAKRRASSAALPQLPDDIACMGAVFIKLYKCEKLTPMDYNGSSDPYVVFRVGSRSKQSSIKGTTLNPVRLSLCLGIVGSRMIWLTNALCECRSGTHLSNSSCWSQMTATTSSRWSSWTRITSSPTTRSGLSRSRSPRCSATSGSQSPGCSTTTAARSPSSSSGRASKSCCIAWHPSPKTGKCTPFL